MSLWQPCWIKSWIISPRMYRDVSLMIKRHEYQGLGWGLQCLCWRCEWNRAEPRSADKSEKDFRSSFCSWQSSKFQGGSLPWSRTCRCLPKRLSAGRNNNEWKNRKKNMTFGAHALLACQANAAEPKRREAWEACGNFKVRLCRLCWVLLCETGDSSCLTRTSCQMKRSQSPSCGNWLCCICSVADSANTLSRRRPAQKGIRLDALRQQINRRPFYSYSLP